MASHAVSHATWLYLARLVIASVVSASSLLRDSSEGVLASMLLSPVGEVVLPLAPAIVAGDLVESARLCALLCASLVSMVASGALVRVWQGRRNVTEQMKARMAPFDMRATWTYAAVIGCMMTSLRIGRNGAKTIGLADVGLAIAISITPPIVNAGVLWIDNVRRRDAASATKRTEGMLNSGSLALINILGIVASGLALSFVVRRRASARA